MIRRVAGQRRVGERKMAIVFDQAHLLFANNIRWRLFVVQDSMNS